MTESRASRPGPRLVAARALGAGAALAFTSCEYVSVWLGDARLCDPIPITATAPASAFWTAFGVAVGVLLVLWPIALLWGESRALTQGTVAFLIALTIGVFLSSRVLLPAHLGVAARQGRPLIEAIHRYAAREGRAPTTLEALVPGDLERYPETWLGTGRYEYEAVDDATGGARWSLTVWLRIDGHSAPPCLRYESDERYDVGAFYQSTAPSIHVRRIGRWAYCTFG
jgi:hypothetical protein